MSILKTFLSTAGIYNTKFYYKPLTRKFFGLVELAFNRVDVERLKLVGSERMCAEWIMKNGGAVRFSEYPTILYSNYNSLPPEKTRLHLLEVDATNATIMRIGFEHFKNCTEIKKIKLHNCTHLESGAFQSFVYIKDTLNYLQISSCSNINEQDLLDLKVLKNLIELKIYDLLYIKDLNTIHKKLQTLLPKCNISITA